MYNKLKTCIPSITSKTFPFPFKSLQIFTISEFHVTLTFWSYISFFFVRNTFFFRVSFKNNFERNAPFKKTMTEVEKFRSFNLWTFVSYKTAPCHTYSATKSLNSLSLQGELIAAILEYFIISRNTKKWKTNLLHLNLHQTCLSLRIYWNT